MKIQQILDTIQELAQSQGFYGRLYRALIETKNNEPTRWAGIVNELEAQNFHDTLDVVLYFEQ